MKMSVIVPAVNEESRITGAVSSAWAAGAVEVVVVDGGSQDETCRLAVEAGAHLISSRPGRAVQQNVGARETQGDVLLFLHADCRLPVDAGAQVDGALGDASVVGGAFRQEIDARGWLFRLLERGNAWRAARRQVPYGDQGLFVRRDCFEAAGGFPEVPLMDDVMLVRKLSRIGHLALVDGPLYVDARRWRQRGVVRQTLCNWSLVCGWRCGASLEWLARHYRRHDQR